MKIKNSNKNNGFTLVELIVVITILAILGTIAFLSFQWYSSSARDSTRLTDITNISKGLSVYSVTAWSVPIPDSYVTATGGALYSILQWVAWKNVLGLVKMSESKDSLDGNYYSYATNLNRTHFTVWGFLENIDTLWIAPFVDITYAVDYSKRILVIKWDAVGILTESGASEIAPIEQMNTTGDIIDIATTWKDLTLNISKTNTIVWSGQILWVIQSLQNGNFSFREPKTCPKGFIPVPGNQEFNQPGFCVMKYEAKALGGVIWPTNGNTAKTHDYNSVTDVIVSNALDVPIGTITQPSAVSACTDLWPGYHLITNNEWMTIARNIEANSKNWSNGGVGSWFIYSGHSSNNPASALVASVNDTDSLIWFTGWTGTTVWLNSKRTLSLSNWQVIWDLAWNMIEHVNKANTLNNTNLASDDFLTTSACSNGTWAWWSWFGSARGSECILKNSYIKTNYWPKGLYDSNAWVWMIYSGDLENSANGIFVRGGFWNFAFREGIYELYLAYHSGNAVPHLGFRCTK